jgi:hypothetical protein
MDKHDTFYKNTSMKLYLFMNQLENICFSHLDCIAERGKERY